MNVQVFHFNFLGAACVVLSSPEGHALVADPCWYTEQEREKFYAYLKAEGLTPSGILLTHAHFDHIFAVKELSEAFHIPVYMSPAEELTLKEVPMQCTYLGLAQPILPFEYRPVKEGDVIDLDGAEIEVLLTPGHSAGGLCFLCRSEKLLLSGDVLFAGTIGRTDFTGGDYDVLMESIFTKLMPLEGDIRVIPGHGRETTIGEERSGNPMLQPFNEPFEDTEEEGQE